MMAGQNRDPEDCPFCIDCWDRPNPNVDHDEPRKRFGYLTMAEAEQHAEQIWKAGNYATVKLYEKSPDIGDEYDRWKLIDEWPAL